MKILVSGGWGYGNLGDEVILQGTLNALSKVLPKAQVTIMSFDPVSTEAWHGVQAIPSVHKIIGIRKYDTIRAATGLLYDFIAGRLNFPRVLSQLKTVYNQSDLFIQAGGGYFNDLWRQAFPMRLLELLLALRTGIPTMIVAQTLGPFRYMMSRFLLKKLLQEATAIYVRDTTSLRLLQRLGLPASLCADSAHLAGIFQPEKRLRNLVQSKRIGVTLQQFRPYVSENSTQAVPMSRADFFRGIANVLYRVSTESGYDLTLTPSTLWDNDWDACVTVEKMLKDMGLKAVAFRPNSPYELIDRISRSSIYVSMNMHPLIVAAGFSIPVIAISYWTKVDDFMNSLDLSHWVFRINDPQTFSATADAILSALDFAGRTSFITKYAEKVEIQRAKAMVPFEVLRCFKG